MRVAFGLAVVLAAIVAVSPLTGSQAQTDGAAVFNRACATCHQAGEAEAPSPEALRAFTPEGIVNALTNGKMNAQGAGLSTAERAAVAQFLTGRAPAVAAVANQPANRCSAATPTLDPANGPAWMNWGNDATNSRYAPKAGLTAADLPRLKLKWAFGYEGATTARPQPAMAGGMVFAGSDNAQVYALDPKTGCAYWSFKAEASVRSGLTVGPYKKAGQTRYAVFFGDQKANAYALDTVTGQQVWKRNIDDYPVAAITGALTIQDGKVFVGVQGLNEEGTGGRGQPYCCKFRGSLSALNADTGELIWRTYTIDEPKPRGKNTRSGQDAFGPAGGSIWSAATVDLKRRSVYVATGNGYADPPQPMTDAIIALDIDNGKVKWFYQALAGDNWLGGCNGRGGGNPGCPENQGPDFDFSASPLLATLEDGRQLLVTPQKAGLAHAVDPDTGKLVWQYRFGQGNGLGGVWGAASDGKSVYFGVSDGQGQIPGGIHAVKLATGEKIWNAAGPQPRLCGGRCGSSQGAAVTLIPGALIAGSQDGGLRAYSTEDGKVLWEFDTNKEFTTVNGVKGTGASIDGSPLIIGGGMIFSNSGYGGLASRPGNVLLAFGLD